MKKSQLKLKLKKHSKKILITTSVILVTTSSSALLIQNTANLNAIPYNGVLIENINVGSLSLEELPTIISNTLHDFLDTKKLIFKHNDIILEATPYEIGYTFDVDTIIKEATSYGKSGNAFKDSLTRVQLYLSPQKIQYSLTLDEGKLNNFIALINEKFSTPPINPEITFTEDTLHLSESQEGLIVDIENFKKILADLSTINFSTNDTIDIPLITSVPKLDTSIQDKLTILGSASTKLPSMSGGRTTNIRVFCNKLNGTIVAPGEEFSANLTAGSRTAKDGYHPAPIFVNGEVKNALAGGICQATTTLYNSLLYSDLEITERFPHSMVVTYMKKGLDAAIVGTYKDLKFKNNTNHPVIVQTYITNNGYVKANIWGVNEHPTKEIKLRAVNHGPKAATSYKDTYLDGKLVKSEKLSYDTYK